MRTGCPIAHGVLGGASQPMTHPALLKLAGTAHRGAQPAAQLTPFGHEYCGVVEEVGTAVRAVTRGQFVVASCNGRGANHRDEPSRFDYQAAHDGP
jgi:hypothetical protein